MKTGNGEKSQKLFKKRITLTKIANPIFISVCPLIKVSDSTIFIQGSLTLGDKSNLVKYLMLRVMHSWRSG